VRTALDRLGWSEEDLERRRKGDPDKATIARQLKSETTMTAAWIARQLRMGSESNVRRLVAMNEQNAKSRDWSLPRIQQNQFERLRAFACLL
jgi:hypothetical protein